MIDDPEKNWKLFKVAVDTRQLEIQLFWQRSNYFLVLNSGAVAGFALANEKGLGIWLALFGIGASFLWFLVNLGSKYWQVRWEVAAERLEEHVDQDAKLFAATPDEVKAAVRAGLERGKRNFLRKAYDWCVLQKPSVTFMMTALSVGFFLLWVILAGVSVSGEDRPVPPTPATGGVQLQWWNHQPSHQ